MLTETGFPAERLVVEITESSLFADIDLARSIVTSLKNQGIRLALDDFGTGFSSLSHLRSLPFDVIKIDRSFVATSTANRESAAIVRAVTTLASALGVPVMVEGIEDAEAHDAVLGSAARSARAGISASRCRRRGRAIARAERQRLPRQRLRVRTRRQRALKRLKPTSRPALGRRDRTPIAALKAW